MRSAEDGGSTGDSYASERADNSVSCGRHHREFSGAWGRGEGSVFSARRWKERPEGMSLGGVTIAIFCKTVRAGGHRACDEKHRKQAQKGGKTLAKPRPGGQKPSQKGAKTFPKPPPGGPGRVLGPLGAPIEKKDQKKTGVTPKLESYFGGVLGTFRKTVRCKF